MLKDIKEIINKEVRETRRIMSHQVENIKETKP